MLYNFFELCFIFTYFFTIIILGIGILLLLQLIIYQGSRKKINPYKTIMNSKFLWK